MLISHIIHHDDELTIASSEHNVVTYSKYALVTQKHIFSWLNWVVLSYLKTLPSAQNVCLILDSASIHRNEELRQLIKSFSIELLLVPPNTTGMLQINDLVVFGTVKAKRRKQFTDNESLTPLRYYNIIIGTSKLLLQYDKYIIRQAFNYVANSDVNLLYDSRNVWKYIRQIKLNVPVDDAIATMLQLSQ